MTTVEKQRLPCSGSGMITPSYLRGLFLPHSFQAKVSHAVCILSRFGLSRFDRIAFSGMSGAMIAPAVACELGKTLVMVRKSSDKTHSSFKVEGELLRGNYVIIDDQISSGRTVRRIQQQIHEAEENEKAWGSSPKICVAIYTWMDNYLFDRETTRESELFGPDFHGGPQEVFSKSLRHKPNPNWMEP